MRFYIEWHNSLLCALASKSTCAWLRCNPASHSIWKWHTKPLWLSLQHPILFRILFGLFDFVNSSTKMRLTNLRCFLICARHFDDCTCKCGAFALYWYISVPIADGQLLLLLKSMPNWTCFCENCTFRSFISNLFFSKFFCLCEFSIQKSKKHKNIVDQSQSELRPMRSATIFVHWY